MTTKTQYKVIKQIRQLSNNYHIQSLLSYELSRSLEIKCERDKMTDKEFKEYLSGNWFKDKIKGFEEMLK
jgi:hypothetical protein